VELVTAAGERLSANADVHPDVLWAARGGGTAFPGVVTAFSLRLHQRPRAIFQSTRECPLTDTLSLAAWADRVVDHLSPAVEVTFQLICPKPGRPSLLISATAFSSDRDGSTLLTPLEGTAGDHGSQSRCVERKSFSELYEGPLEAYPRRHRYVADHFWTDQPVGSLITHLVRVTEEMPSPKCHLLIYSPPHPGEPPAPGASFAQLGSTFVGCYAVWDDPRSDEAHDAWIDNVRSTLAPIAAGHYIGEADLSLDTRSASDCFQPASWKRLQSLAARVDPTGMFKSPTSNRHSRRGGNN
jgi:FAD/FMN-containing dehydrogenase